MSERRKIYICIGSNEPKAMKLVREAGIAIGEFVGGMHMCGPYETRPYPPAPPDGPAYANAVICGETELDLQTIRNRLKELERLIGRRPEHKSSGKVVIDMDVVIYDNEICRRVEFEADYFRYGYDILVREV